MRQMTKLLGVLICLIVVFGFSGCASAVIGSYRGARIADRGKWVRTTCFGFPDYISVKFNRGLTDRTELGLGIFMVGGNAEWKTLILDEKKANNAITLATKVGANIPVFPVLSSIGLSLIAEKTLWSYRENSISSISVYCGTEVKYIPVGKMIYFYPHTFYHEGEQYTDWFKEVNTGYTPGGVFIGSKILLKSLTLGKEHLDNVFLIVEIGYLYPGNQPNFGAGITISRD